MKRRLFLYLGLSLLILGVLSGVLWFFGGSNSTSKKEGNINKIFVQAAAELNKKYGMRFVATHMETREEYAILLSINFQLSGPLTKNEIRPILIDAATKIVSLLDSDSNEDYQGNIQNIALHLNITGAQSKRLEYPSVGIAKIAGGKIEYLTFVTIDRPSIVTECTETYQEAMLCMENNQ